MEKFSPLTYVIPTYNGAQDLGRCLESILGQEGKTRNVIVVDDGSTDDTMNVVKRYKSRVKYVWQENAGSSAARNHGLSFVDTEIVCFVDHDDYVFGPHALMVETQWKTCYDVLIGLGAEEQDNHLRLALKNKYPVKADSMHLLREYLRDNCVQTLTLCWSADFLRRIGKWDSDLHVLTDIDLAFRAFLSGASIRISNDQGWIVWRHRPGSISRSADSRIATSHVILNRKLGMLLEKEDYDEETMGLFFHRCMRTARALYLNGYSERANEMIGLATSRGYRGYQGPVGEVVAASFIGAANTMRMRSMIGRIKRRVLGMIERHGSQEERSSL